MRENIIKIYWQAMNGDGRESIFTQRPLLDGAMYELVDGSRSYKNLIYTFPITLKPLQIAKITVVENGTWSYEIEREEGWYIVRHLEGNRDSYSGQGVVTYSKGKFSWLNDGEVDADDLKHLAISSARIPDECII